MRARDVLFSGFSVCYVGMCGVGYLGMPLIRGAILCGSKMCLTVW